MNRNTTSAGTAAATEATPKAPSRSLISRTALLVGVSVVLATAAPAFSSTASAATTEKFAYTGSAYGTWAAVGSVVKSGPSAPLTFGCTTDGNLHRTNTIAGVNLAPLLTTGTVSTTADTYASPVKSSTSASTAQVNLLGGLVKASVVKAASSTTRTATGYALSSSGTTLTSLVVGGVPVRADAAPNTRIDLAGVGYVVVNEQVRSTNGLKVSGLHVFVNTVNALGFPVNTNLVVSQAISGLSAPVIGVMSGYSYGTKVNVGTLVTSGSSFTAYLPCLGTGGVLRTNTGAGINIGTALNTGTIANTAKGTVSATAINAETTSTVQGANLLNGLVKATVIKADARGSKTGTTYSFSDTGSSFGSLTVAGHPEITAKVAPNTTVAIQGVGTLYLHRVIRTNGAVTVRMIELVITSPVNGLAVGTNIQVAVAVTGVK
ncbi:MAG: hypothetical protein H0T91_07140 [Propionibacteriaceae bacterium]|nr:hypothetical protein [Propionibacteriaceae bacterium]